MIDYLEFREFKNEKGQTLIVNVISKGHGDLLGKIHWHWPWRQYCFFPEEKTTWSASCLLDVMNYLNKLNKDHKGSCQT